MPLAVFNGWNIANCCLKQYFILDIPFAPLLVLFQNIPKTIFFRFDYFWVLPTVNRPTWLAVRDYCLTLSPQTHSYLSELPCSTQNSSIPEELDMQSGIVLTHTCMSDATLIQLSLKLVVWCKPAHTFGDETPAWSVLSALDLPLYSFFKLCTLINWINQGKERGILNEMPFTVLWKCQISFPDHNILQPLDIKNINNCRLVHESHLII